MGWTCPSNRAIFFGFIGPNGAGKSTTIHILLGLISPTQGEGYVLGKNIKERTAILRRTGYLPSEAVLYRNMKAKDVLALSAAMRGMDCTSQAKALCERLALDPSRRIDELSFGNRKKVAIICALQSNPSLLILDEPTGGLDPLMQREFFTILRERNCQGTTVFLSSHVLSEIQRNCTRAAIIREGRLIACDSVSALSKTNARRVTFHGSAALGGLSGIRDKTEANGTTSFLYSGAVEPLLKALAAGEIDELTISEPDLEEVFLHYYEKDGEDA